MPNGETTGIKMFAETKYIDVTKIINFDGENVTYKEAIEKIIERWGRGPGQANLPISIQLKAGNNTLRDLLVDDVIKFFNTHGDERFELGTGTAEIPPTMNQNVQLMLYNRFSSQDFPSVGATDETVALKTPIRLFHEYLDDDTQSSGTFANNIEPPKTSDVIDRYFNSYIEDNGLHDAAATRLRNSSKREIEEAWANHSEKVEPGIPLQDFLEDILGDTIDAGGSIGLIQPNVSSDLLRDVFESRGKLSLDSISPNWVEEWNRSASIAHQGYLTYLAKHRAIQEQMAAAVAANDVDLVKSLKAQSDQVENDWSGFLGNIADNFPTEEQMIVNKQVATQQGRQQLFYNRAQGMGLGEDGMMEDLPSLMARAFQELEQQYLMAGPDADYSAMVDDYFGEGGEKFQSRFGVTPPAMPGLPDAKEAQRRYQEVVDRGGSAKEIMDVLQGLDPGAVSESNLSNFIDDPNVLDQVREFSDNLDPEGLSKYLRSTATLYPENVAQLQEAQRDYLRYISSGGTEGISKEEFDAIVGHHSGLDEAIDNTVKIVQDAVDENIKQTGDPGGDAYKGIYNPYEPPKETDSRLYTPAAPNIGFEDLPQEGTPGTVRYDKEGRPLGPLYSDIMTDAQATIDARSAEMGINPEEYTTGDDPTLDAAYKSLDEAYAARSEAEAAIAADKPEEDYLPPEPEAPAPEITQFTTRTRGGRRGY